MPPQLYRFETDTVTLAEKTTPPPPGFDIFSLSSSTHKSRGIDLRRRTCEAVMWNSSQFPQWSDSESMTASSHAQTPESQRESVDIKIEEKPKTYSSPSRRLVLGKRSPFREVSRSFQAG